MSCTHGRAQFSLPSGAGVSLAGLGAGVVCLRALLRLNGAGFLSLYPPLLPESCIRASVHERMRVVKALSRYGAGSKSNEVPISVRMCGLCCGDARIAPGADTGLCDNGRLSCVMGAWPYHTGCFFGFQALLDVMRLTALSDAGRTVVSPTDR